MTRKKKIWITSSVVVGIICILILLIFTLFSLRKIEVNYKTSTQVLNLTDEEIIESSQIDYGGTVFFRDKDKYIENLERTYPYIKVINIETRFPSTFVIHVAEREEVYAIPYGLKCYIVDNELKILNILDDFVSTEENAILLSNAQVKDKAYNKGDKLVCENFIDLYSAIFENNRALSEQRTIIEKIDFAIEHDDEIKEDQIVCSLKLFNGQTYKIYNASYGLKYKAKMFIDVYSQIFSFIGKEITLDDGSKVTLTEENLTGATIAIRNYYNYSEHTEKDCYFDIIPILE